MNGYIPFSTREATFVAYFLLSCPPGPILKGVFSSEKKGYSLTRNSPTIGVDPFSERRQEHFTKLPLLKVFVPLSNTPFLRNDTDTLYSRISIARTPMARLPWLIRTRF